MIMPYQAFIQETGVSSKVCFHVAKRIQPTADRVRRDLHLIRQIGIYQLFRGSLMKNGRQVFDLSEFMDRRQLAQVLPKERLAQQMPSLPCESGISSQEGLGVTTVPPKRGEFLLGNAARGTHDPIGVGQVLRRHFRHRERMHAVRKISAHKTVAAAAVYVQARRAGHHDPCFSLIRVEETLKEILPSPKLVQFIKQNDRQLLCGLSKAGFLSDGGRPRGDIRTMFSIVPIKV